MEREESKSTATGVDEGIPGTAPDEQISPEDASFARRNGYTEGPREPATGSYPSRAPFSDVLRVYWGTALVPLVLLVVGAAAFGLLRAPTYTAEARLTVEIPTANPEAIPGSVTASQALASSYSRSIYDTAVVKEASKKAGLSPAETERRLSATPIPDSPVIRVVAEGPDEEQMLTLANAGAEALTRNAVTTNTSDLASEKIFREFEQAAREYEARLAAEKEADQVADRAQTAETEQVLAEAQVATQGALLERETLREQYQLSKQANDPALEPLARADSATSDRSSMLQILLFAGAATGLVLGIGLAALRAYWVG